MRRHPLTAALFVLAAAASLTPAAGEGGPTSWESLLERRTPVADVRQMMTAFVERQLAPVPEPASLDEWKDRRAPLRKEILRITGVKGLVPPRWSLNLTRKGTIQRPGYRIEKITYETYPGFANAALLYIPEGVKGKVPGIVSISGHTRESKAAEYVQQRNVNLVKRGCVVLSYDYLGFNERTPGGRPAGPNSHGIRSFSYTRRCPTTLEILDAWRAVDVLCGRQEVDKNRIGFTGESGGSNSTYWIAALDPRVKVAVAVSSVSTFNYWIRKDNNWDWHQRPTGIRRIADIGTLLALHAPNPLVIVTSKRRTDDEEFPWEEAEISHQWARHVYGLYGATDRINHYESITQHGYQEDKRQQLYEAVERWLKPPSAANGKELPAQIETEADLRCGLPENNRTFSSIYAEWLAPLPRTTNQSRASQRRFLREHLGWPANVPDPTWKRSSAAFGLEQLEIETEPGIRLSALLIRRKGSSEIALVPGRQKASVASALASGKDVLAFDPRGVADSSPGIGGQWAAMAGEPYSTLLGPGGGSWTNWSWFAGRPVSGQWALDNRQLARCCRLLGYDSVSIAAENDFGWPAILAAAAEPGLFANGRVQLRHRSLREELAAGGDQALSDVPGLLERLDIPQLQRLCPQVQIAVKP